MITSRTGTPLMPSRSAPNLRRHEPMRGSTPVLPSWPPINPVRTLPSPSPPPPVKLPWLPASQSKKQHPLYKTTNTTNFSEFSPVSNAPPNVGYGKSRHAKKLKFTKTYKNRGMFSDCSLGSLERKHRQKTVAEARARALAVDRAKRKAKQLQDLAEREQARLRRIKEREERRAAARRLAQQRLGAAIRMQRWWSAHRLRQELDMRYYRKLMMAALLIQKNYRTHQTKVMFRKLLYRSRCTRAAIKFQRLFRSQRVCRRHYAALAQRRQAYHSKLDALRTEVQKTAARKIQAAYIGYKIRSYFAHTMEDSEQEKTLHAFRRYIKPVDGGEDSPREEDKKEEEEEEEDETDAMVRRKRRSRAGRGRGRTARTGGNSPKAAGPGAGAGRGRRSRTFNKGDSRNGSGSFRGNGKRARGRASVGRLSVNTVRANASGGGPLTPGTPKRGLLRSSTTRRGLGRSNGGAGSNSNLDVGKGSGGGGGGGGSSGNRTSRTPSGRRGQLTRSPSFRGSARKLTRAPSSSRLLVRTPSMASAGGGSNGSGSGADSARGSPKPSLSRTNSLSGNKQSRRSSGSGSGGESARGSPNPSLSRTNSLLGGGSGPSSGGGSPVASGAFADEETF